MERTTLKDDERVFLDAILQFRMNELQALEEDIETISQAVQVPLATLAHHGITQNEEMVDCIVAALSGRIEELKVILDGIEDHYHAFLEQLYEYVEYF